MGGHDFWTSYRVTILTRMWEAGKTATQIANALDCTRHAVIGKAHRLGLGGRCSPVITSDPAETERRRQRARKISQDYKAENWRREALGLPPLPRTKVINPSTAEKMARRALVLQLAKEGVRPTEIARRVGIKVCSVAGFLRRNYPEYCSPASGRWWNQNDRSDALRALHAAGFGTRFIANALGCSRSRVRRQIEVLGLRGLRPAPEPALIMAAADALRQVQA